jgi:hypothetical protein
MEVEMRKVAFIVMVVGLAAGTAVAGEIYGKITEGGAAVGEGASVSVKCGAKAYPAQKTDKTGSYHLVVEGAGKCALTVALKGQSASLDVVSYDDPVQVDIVAEVKDGKLAVRRK